MQLLTPKQVASRLSVSPRTVYGWIAEGRLASVRLSERVTRVPEDAVDAMVRTALSPAKSSATGLSSEHCRCVAHCRGTQRRLSLAWRPTFPTHLRFEFGH